MNTNLCEPHVELDIPGSIAKRCGCQFALADEQPSWVFICDAHKNALTIQYRIIRRHIAQQVLDE